MMRRTIAQRLGILLGMALALGALSAVIWSRVTILPVFVVSEGGHATMGASDMSQVASADWTFAVIALIGGGLLGAASWRLLRSVGWPVALVTVGLAVVAGLTCWLLGEALGPDPFDQRVAEAVAGDTVPVALILHARSALALWPFAAVAVPLFAASLGPEIETEDEAPGWEPLDAQTPAASSGSPN